MKLLKLGHLMIGHANKASLAAALAANAAQGQSCRETQRQHKTADAGKL
jgi:hypothetical protein